MDISKIVYCDVVVLSLIACRNINAVYLRYEECDRTVFQGETVIFGIMKIIQHLRYGALASLHDVAHVDTIAVALSATFEHCVYLTA